MNWLLRKLGLARPCFDCSGTGWFQADFGDGLAHYIRCFFCNRQGGRRRINCDACGAPFDPIRGHQCADAVSEAA